jgi:hypothetical protein
MNAEGYALCRGSGPTHLEDAIMDPKELLIIE